MTPIQFALAGASAYVVSVVVLARVAFTTPIGDRTRSMLSVYSLPLIAGIALALKIHQGVRHQ